MKPCEAVEKTPDLRLLFTEESGKSVLAESFSRMPFRVFPPFSSPASGAAYTYIVNPTPGFLGGDRAKIEILLEPGAHAVIAGPSATKILHTSPDRAEQTTNIHLADGAILEYLPSYVIPFAGARFTQRTVVHIESTSTCLLLDWFSTGRTSRGERLAFESYDNATIVMCGERPVICERLLLEPANEAYGVPCRLESYAVSASLYLIHGCSPLSRHLLDDVRDVLGRSAALAGASDLDGNGMVIKVLGATAPSVQNALIPAIGLLRKNLFGIDDDPIFNRLVGAL